MMSENGQMEMLKQLASATRNNYFYGKLLDVHHFQMEQKYFNRKRWMLNRLSLGSGVLCGLEVLLTEDGNHVGVRPGVAIDPLGREIVVPEPVSAPLADLLGQEEGSQEQAITLCLAYLECDVEPVPVLVGDCDTKESCAPSTIRERYRLFVTKGLPEEPGGISEEQCRLIFPTTETDESFNRRQVACTTLSGACPVPSSECVVLATLSIDENGVPTLDACRYRTTVYTNATLFDMLLCLSDRVDACCRVRLLRYVSGDAQSAEPGTLLPEPLVVEVVNGEGEPVPGEPVRFQVRGGGGRVGVGAAFGEEFHATTDANGQASVRWRIGAQAGLNSAEALIESGSSVVFHSLGVAVGEEPGTTLAPVVMAQWLPNGTSLSRENPEQERWQEAWLEMPRIELTFDRPMNEEQLAEMGSWLQIRQLLLEGEKIVIRPVELGLAEVKEESILGQKGVTAVYKLGVEPEQPARYVVLMRARSNNIMSDEPEPKLLDAEFRGTRLTGAQVKLLWEATGEMVQPNDAIWQALPGSDATLPKSGDGNLGGNYDSWFEISE
jgi:hypothetical protein